MDDLAFADGKTPSANMKLHVLENSLANMTAAIAWASIKSDTYTGSFRPIATRGQSLVSTAVHIGRLHVRRLHPPRSLLELIASVICVFLAQQITSHPKLCRQRDCFTRLYSTYMGKTRRHRYSGDPASNVDGAG